MTGETEIKAERDDPMWIWNTLGRTNPDMTKTFERGGGFKGTAIKPIFNLLRMTELFGPCGIGWGATEPQFKVVPGGNQEVLVFCTIALWFVDPHTGQRSDPIPGVGGDKIVKYIKANEQYNRPERWENSDEALKAAFTDALANAMKHVGMSADVHLGLFDDQKYVKQLRDEFSAEPAPPPPPPAGLTAEQVSSRLRDKEAAERVRAEIMTAQTEAQIDSAMNVPEVDRLERERPDIFDKLWEIADRARRNVPAF